jgi:hypothetical protein
MKTLYLHIGAGKTGTTSIQQMLFDNQEKLKENDFLYITESHNINHSNIIHWQPNMRESIIKSFGILKDKFLKSSCDNMIISSENMMGLNVEYLNIIKEIFKDSFSIKIIVYLRNQIEHLPTHFLEKQKRPIPYPGYNIKSFFNKFKDTFCNEHNIVMNIWEKVYGRENIIIRVFDKKSLEKGNVCEDFAKVLNINSFIDFYDYYQNDSLLPETSSFIACLDREFPKLIEYSSESFNFRQSVIIKKLLELSNNYKNNKDTQKSTLIINSIEIEIKKYFNIQELNSLLKKELEKMRENILSNKKCILIDEEFKKEILSYYKESSSKLASNYLNDLEKDVFLKYYNIKSLRKGKYYLFENLKNFIEPNFESKDILREIALAFEENGDISIAKSIMQKAHELSPNELIIKQKLEEYKKILDESK